MTGPAAPSRGPRRPTLDLVTQPAPELSRTTIQSVSRASRLLFAVAAEPDGLAAKAAAEQLGLSLPTTYHLLTTLVAEGLLAKDSRRRYVLGPRAGVIAAAVNRDNRAPEYYVAPLRDLAARTGETAYLSAWRSGAITVLSTVEGAHAVRVAGLSAGYRDNEHARASGKLLLAFASPADRDRLLNGSTLRRLTPATITDRSLLDAEFERIREEGLAYDRGEFYEGVECVSAPIIEGGTVVACYTVSTPADRFAADPQKIIDAVRAAGGAASNLRLMD
jgi:IclR family acetate operon transcriptional repressor